MKNSTILVVSTLVLGGAGAYFYFKNKKAKASDTTATTPTSTTATTTPTPPPTTDDKKLLQDLGVKVEEPKPTPYVKPVEGVPLLTAENLQKALLALGIDQTRSVEELASPNYKEAKSLAWHIQNYSSSAYKASYSLYEKKVSDMRFTKNKTPITPVVKHPILGINEATKKLNELGYKILPNFSIEKM